jgi:hypothetical protein
VIDGCDSGVPNQTLSGGGTMAQQIDACLQDAKNHGQFVSCTAHLANGWKKAGLISGSERGSVVSCAAKAR